MDVSSVPSESELNRLLKETFTCDFRKDYQNVDGFILPDRYSLYEKQIKDYPVFDSDVWICGFPKTGTTWISEIAWLIAHDFNYEGAKVDDYKRIRMLEFSMLFDITGDSDFAQEPYLIDSINYSNNQPHPRTIKTHLPFSLTPEQLRNGSKQPKIIYTARNPMDTCISYYYHCQNYEGYIGTFEEFCKLFLYNKTNYGPFYKHVLSFWNVRQRPNVLFLSYEEMKRDLPGVIQKVGNLLGKQVSNENSIRLQQHVSFDSMKKNPFVNKENIPKYAGKRDMAPFIREGKVGGYKATMSADLIAKFEYWTDKWFAGSGLSFF